MNCPKCNSTNLVQVEDLMRCHSCEYYFKPYVPPTETKADIVMPVVVVDHPAMIPVRRKIKRQADSFVLLSYLFLAIGLLCLMIGIAEGGAGIWITAGSMFGTSSWFYVVGQIIHIRANTEK